MKNSELRAKSVDELKTELSELQKEAFKLRFMHKLGQLQNSDKLRQVRRDIARVLTVLGNKQNAKSAE